MEGPRRTNSIPKRGWNYKANGRRTLGARLRLPDQHFREEEGIYCVYLSMLLSITYPTLLAVIVNIPISTNRDKLISAKKYAKDQKNKFNAIFLQLSQEATRPEGVVSCAILEEVKCLDLPRIEFLL